MSDEKNVTPEDNLYQNCLRCGRKLRSIDSKKIGYGPVCYRKIHTIEEGQKQLFNLHESWQ